MGQVIAMARCPYHDDNTPSLAIYDNGYYCFGCKKSGSLEPWMTDLITGNDSTDKYKRPVNLDKFSPILTPDVISFFSDRGITKSAARQYGVSCTETQVCIPSYNFDGYIHGYQVRNLKSGPKYKSLPVDGKYASYSYVDLCDKVHLLEQARGIALVESVVDGLCCNKIGVPAIALLGTTLPLSIIPHLTDLRVFILFDPDALVIASHMQDKLGSYGVDAWVLDVGVKPYELTPLDLMKVFMEANNK